MTAPAALRELSLAEAMDVFDQSAERTTPNRQTQAWVVIRAELKRMQETQLRTAASEGGEELVVGEDGWIDPVTRDNESLVQCALENYARASHYRNIGQHNAAMACKAELLRRLTHPPEVARDAGLVSVPREPTESQWSGLARDVIMWMNAYDRHSSETLLKHLERSGTEIPDWLRKEADTGPHSLPKGSIAAIIYKAMIADAPKAAISGAAGVGDG